MTVKSTPKSACALCKKPIHPDYKPFCSKRCADVDLNRWLSEDYRILTDEPSIANDPYAQDNSEY